MFLYSKWLSLDLPTRIKIAEIFDIIKRGSTHVVDNRIQSDGYNIEEVEAKLSVENLQKYLVTKESDPHVLWDLFTARLEGKEVEQVIEPPLEQKATMSVLPPKEAKQFKKEHKARVAEVKKKATKLSEKVKTIKKNVTKRITKKK